MANRLAREASPYLRQHADNPVDWYPWGEEAFAEARRRDVPVLLSVGYSSCHWCHVMAHESFEDPETAEAVNSRFVAVKVDREERPDVDAVYMEAVQVLSGRGGWPMTVFLTPDGRPIVGGTYFPRRDTHGLPSFRRVLDTVDDAWRTRRAEVLAQADELTEAVTARSGPPSAFLGSAAGDEGEPLTPGAPGWPRLARRLLDAADAELAARFDPVDGGFSPAPKFPQPALVELALLAHRATGDPHTLERATATLGAMASGGIYDHLGGGFARYSTDARWTVPHFEKMLYDQAGLVRAYLHAWQATGDERWLQVVDETVRYVGRDLAAGDVPGLCAAEDADSEGEEGRFYVWTPAEVEAVLGPGAAVALDWYGVTAAGNFEGRSVLRRPNGAALLRPAEVEEARRALFCARADRVRPGRDDKVLLEWNAMYGSALAEAAAATGRADWAERAPALGTFLLEAFRRPGDGRLLRSWQDGEARHLAYAADYAWLCDFLVRLAELTGRGAWLERAGAVAADLLRLFSDGSGTLYSTGSDAESLIVRPVDVMDDATPSAASVAAAALLRLGALTGDDALVAAGEDLLAPLVPLATRHPLACANAVAAAQLAGGGITEIVVAGDRPDLVAAVRRRYEPTAVLASGERTPSPLWEDRVDGFAYVCRGYTCRMPVDDEPGLVGLLDEERRAVPA